jgi:glycosyltransferase involved in cell wall biosynthesis
MRHAVEAFRPGVVHVHNTFPLLSPAVFHAIGKRAARVLTLHNYRLFCPAAIPMRAANVCTECMDGHSVRPALTYGCYRNSRLATLPLALNVWLHRTLRTWTRQVDAFIALTEFQRERMIEAGLPAERLHVKPNFYPGNPKPVPWVDRGDYAVFAGRISPEKGVTTLIRAWLDWGEHAPELRVLGEGQLRGSLEGLAASAPVARIRFLGQVSSQDAQREIAGAKLLILPSQCYEGFPMVIREAFAFAVPAAVSAIGPLPSIVQDGVSGVVFAPGDSQSLLQKVREAWKSSGMLEKLAAGSRAAFESRYTEDANYRTLMEIYSSAIAVSKEKARHCA